MPWPSYATMRVRVCTGCGLRLPTRYGVCNDCYDLPQQKRPNAIARRRLRDQARPVRNRTAYLEPERPERERPRDVLVCGCDYMLATLGDKGHPASECPTPKWVVV